MVLIVNCVTSYDCHYLQVINQKVKLGQQLEHWQLDMQKLLEDQIEIKLARNVGLTKF